MTLEQQIWLSAYCSAIAAGNNDKICANRAEQAVKSFNSKYANAQDQL